MRQRILVACCLTALLMGSSQAHGKYKTFTDFMLTVGRDWVTPHIPWGKPYAHGKPRVLFLCPKVIAPRETVELAQRMDMDFDVVITYTSEQLAVSNARSDPYTSFITALRPGGRRKELSAKLEQDWDVIVLGHFRMKAIPEPLRKKLVEEVRKGTGLVLAYDGGFPKEIQSQLTPLEGAEQLLAGMPIEQNPGFIACRSLRETNHPRATKDKGIVRLYQLGKGRVAVIDYGYFHDGFPSYSPCYSLTPWLPFLPYRERDAVVGGRPESAEKKALIKKRYPAYDWSVGLWYDYSLMLPGRVILWASGKHEPQVHVVQAPKAATFKPTEAAAITYTLRADKPIAAEIRYRFLHAGGDELFKSTFKQKLSNKAATVRIPADASLPACDAFCEVVVASDRGVEAWLATPVTIQRPATVKLVSFDRPKYDIGATVTATLVASEGAIGKEVVLSVADLDRRELLRARATIAGETTTVRFNVPPVTTTALVVRPKLYSADGKLLCRAADRTLVVDQAKQRRENYPVIVYSLELGGHLYELRNRQLRRMGGNSLIAYPSVFGFPSAIFGDMVAVPMTAGYPESGFRYGTGDPEAIQRQMEYYVPRTRWLDQYPILFYNFGDEVNMGEWRAGFDLGTDEHWHKRFRKFLAKKYKTIAALNKAWTTEYESFETIPPVKVKEARETKKIAPILERWAFLQDQWNDFFVQAQAIIQRTAPGSIVGWEGNGSDSPIAWSNWRKLGKYVDVHGPYQHCECDLVAGALFRSFMPRRVITGYWWGGYNSMRKPETLRFYLWNHVVRGANSMFWYHAVGAEGLIGADLTPAHHFLLQKDDVKKVLTEIGPLAGKSHWQSDPVAVYWSIPSQVGREVHGGRDIRWNALHGLFHAIRHAGYDPAMVDAESDLGAYRAVVLYDAQCLSDADVKALTEYVRNGGSLISDVPPASCNELGVPRETPPLDGLFGITRDEKKLPRGIVPLRRASVHLNTMHNGTRVRFEHSESNSPVDTHVVEGVCVAAGARALGESVDDIPVFITKKTGRGQTILLNMTFDEYYGSDAVLYTPLGADCEVHRTLVWPVTGARFAGDVLRSVGALPQVRVLGPDTMPLRDIRETLHRNGNDLLLAIACMPSQGKTPATVTLPGEFHVVDLRTGEYLGQRNRIPIEVGPATAHVYSLLKHPPQAPTLTVVRPRLSAASTVKLRVHLPATGRETAVVRIVATGPEGKEVPWLTRTLIFKGNDMTLEAPTAFGDAPGSYSVKATDVSTGRSAVAMFELTTPGPAEQRR